MTFKEIKKGFPVFLLHKTDDGVSASQGKVIDVTGPHLPFNTSGVSLSANTLQQMQQMVMDIVVEEGGAKTQYSIPESLTVTYAENVVIATDQAGIVREAQMMLNNSDDVIRSVPRHEKIKKDCAAILEQWDLGFKERRATETRFQGLEKTMGGVIGRMDGIEGKLDLLLKKLE